jgi:hypothetical protein
MAQRFFLAQATALAKYMEMTGSFVEGNNEQQYCIPVEVSASASFTVIGYVDGFVDLPRFEDIDGNWNITRCGLAPKSVVTWCGLARGHKHAKMRLSVCLGRQLTALYKAVEIS